MSRLNFILSKDDVITITYNLGWNSLIVEMTLRIKNRSNYYCCYFSYSHSKSITFHHDSKLLLKDITHIIIDNNAPSRDATIEIDKQKAIIKK